MNSHTPRARCIRDIQASPSSAESTAQARPSILCNALVLLSAIILVISVVGWWTLGRTTDNLGSNGGFGPGNEKDSAVDILLVGSDSHTDAQGDPLTPEEVELLRVGDEETTNTDTTIMIRVPADGSLAAATSIPCDIYVHANQLGNTKINGIYGNIKQVVEEELVGSGTSPEDVERRSAETGCRTLTEAISDLGDITVDYYAEVGLLGFVLLTDVIGGVSVRLNEAVYDEFSGTNFPAGSQTSKGVDALSFIHQRHSLPRSGLDRIARQQVFMALFTNKLPGVGTLFNPTKLPELGNTAQRSVVLGDSWDVTGFATQMQGLNGDNVKFETIPVTSINGAGDCGESAVTIDEGQVYQYFETLLGTKEEEAPTKEGDEKRADLSAAETTISVYNATGTEGLTGDVSGFLTEKDYARGEIGNTEFAGATSSQVSAADLEGPAAQAISEALGGVPIVHDLCLDPHHTPMIIASDYESPGLTLEGVVADSNDGVEPAPEAESGPNGDVVGRKGGTIPQKDRPAIDATGVTCVN